MKFSSIRSATDVKGLLFAFRRTGKEWVGAHFISFCPVSVFNSLGSVITFVFFVRLGCDLV